MISNDVVIYKEPLKNFHKFDAHTHITYINVFIHEDFYNVTNNIIAFHSHYFFQSSVICQILLHLILITGLRVTVEAGRDGRTMGTRLTTENASLRRATRPMNWDTFCKNCLVELRRLTMSWGFSKNVADW